jgi:hypothetical protein
MTRQLTPEQIAEASKPYVIPPFFVYYSDNGEIFAITSEKDESLNYIEVTSKQVDDFITGKRDYKRYKVDYFKEGNTYVIKTETENPVTHLLLIVPIIEDTEKDLTIVYNNQNKCWDFVLNDAGRNLLKNTNPETVYRFYITKHLDPHFLLTSILVKTSELLTGFSAPFTIDDELDINNISIAVANHFDSCGVRIK